MKNASSLKKQNDQSQQMLLEKINLISLHEKLFASGAEGGNRTSIEIGIDSTVRFHLELNTIYYISEKLCWAEWMFMKAHDFDWKIFENLFLRNKSHNKQ